MPAEDSNFSNIIDLLVNCATFIYIGATMPFQDFENAELTLKAWKLAVLGISVLLVRRLPMMLLLYKWIPDIKTFREAVFAGHFGPMVRMNFVKEGLSDIAGSSSGRYTYISCVYTSYRVSAQSSLRLWP